MQMTLRGDYFAGSFHKATKSDETILKTCPADVSHELWEASVDYGHISQVLESAFQGFQAWRKESLSKRVDTLKRFQEEVKKRQEDIALAIAYETGKPHWESKTEAAALVGKVNVTVGESLERVKNQSIENIMPEITGHTYKKPLGPCLVIGPYNFPCHLANTQILSALLTGNSVIFKPSEKTMYSAQLLIEALDAAGFPSGVVNMIQGTAHTTQEILKDDRIRGIFFTGSYAVGKKILEAVGTDMRKLVALELGGKNATIVHDDAEVEHTLTELVNSCFLSTGQRCTSTSMIYIHQSKEQELIEKFLEITKRIIVDHPVKFKELPFMGPLIDASAKEKYLSYAKLGIDNGASYLYEPQEIDCGFDGHYVSPVIHRLEQVKKDNPFATEEVFGPGCCFIPYSNIEDAIEMVNSNDYGLAASVFTKQKEIYQTCIQDIDTGLVNLNRSTVGASAKLPFGGVKHSGNYHPAAVSMIDHTVYSMASLETMSCTSSIENIKGLK
jgi:succinylglutamic semialdehyde dehydrogenase